MLSAGGKVWIVDVAETEDRRVGGGGRGVVDDGAAAAQMSDDGTAGVTSG